MKLAKAGMAFLLKALYLAAFVTGLVYLAAKGF